MGTYRPRSPWWRARAAYLMLAVLGYILVIIALCAFAAGLLP